jgi:uncharacterized coiled-coil DUF342 family protein
MAENNPEVEQLLNQLKLVKEEVSLLKKKLAVVGKDKEQWFAKKQELSTKIREKISTVRGSKSERNGFTEEARKAKEERDRLNKQISESIREIKALKDSYTAVADKHGVQGNPAELKRRVEKLEYTMQTEPMKFDKEQKLMKEIKDLKKQLAVFEAVHKEWVLVNEKSKEIDALKKQANDFHRVVQQSARSSQEQHESLVTDSKDIDELKRQEEEAYNKFFEQKDVFKELTTQLKDKLKELDGLREKLEGHDVELREGEKKREMKSLREKAAEVEEKISKKKKLTTEDLLVMQRTFK